MSSDVVGRNSVTPKSHGDALCGGNSTADCYCRNKGCRLMRSKKKKKKRKSMSEDIDQRTIICSTWKMDSKVTEPVTVCCFGQVLTV